MNTSANRDDTGLDEFLHRWRTGLAEEDKLRITYGVIALTNFGEYPAPTARFAEVLGVSVGEAETLAEQWGWPGTRVENELIIVDPERATAGSRRRARIGDRHFGVSGCAPDVFLYAPLVRPSIQIEDTCTATGTPIRLAFTPDGVERVDPSDTVVAMVDPGEFTELRAEGIDDYDASLCGLMPFFSSVAAAQGWQADHPDGRVFTLSEAWELNHNRDWRDRISALLNLDN